MRGAPAVFGGFPWPEGLWGMLFHRLALLLGLLPRPLLQGPLGLLNRLQPWLPPRYLRRPFVSGAIPPVAGILFRIDSLRMLREPLHLFFQSLFVFLHPSVTHAPVLASIGFHSATIKDHPLHSHRAGPQGDLQDLIQQPLQCLEVRVPKVRDRPGIRPVSRYQNLKAHIANQFFWILREENNPTQ